MFTAYHLEHSHGMEKTNKKQEKSATSVATAAGAATVTLVSTPSLHPQSTPLQQSAPHQPQHQHPQSQPLQSELNNGHVVQQSSETLNQSQDKTIGRLMGNPFTDFAGSSATATATAAASAATTWGSDTVKPYICPHHGCGKAFKNKNGLSEFLFLLILLFFLCMNLLTFVYLFKPNRLSSDKGQGAFGQSSLAFILLFK